jgi:O-antigen/teichoic acid export membrane protein
MTTALRGGTALYASATLLDRVLGLLLLPLLTRSLLPGDYGAWTQTAVAAGLLMPLVLFATPTAIVRWFASPLAAGQRARHFVTLGAFVGGLYLACAGIVLALDGAFAQAVYGHAGRAALLPALLALLLADAGVDIANSWLRAASRMAWVAGVLALRSVLRFCSVLWLVGEGGAPLVNWLGTYAAAQCALALGVLAAVYALLRRDAAPGGTAIADAAAPALPSWRAGLVFCTPLVLLALFTVFNATFDRMLLVSLLGLDAVAVYSAAASLAGVPAVFYSVLGFTVFPVLARHWAQAQQHEAARLTTLAARIYLYLCVPLAVVLAIVGPDLLPLLSTARYQAPQAVFGWLGVSVAAFGVYQLLLYALLLDGRSKQVLWLALAAAALNAALNLLLVPRWGASGAAAAAAAANAVMAAWAARWAARVMPWRFPWRALGAVGQGAALLALPLLLVPLLGPVGLGWHTAAALALGGAAYLALDWARRESIARMLLAR